MKCRKGDYVTMNNGKTDFVIQGTSKDDGLITVIEHIDDYGGQRIGRHAEDIIKIERHGKVIWEKD